MQWFENYGCASSKWYLRRYTIPVLNEITIDCQEFEWRRKKFCGILLNWKLASEKRDKIDFYIREQMKSVNTNSQ